jgi:AraC-like DNA-binding protein
MRRAMFSNHFAFSMPATGASFEQDELRGTDLMVMRARFRGGVVDETLHRPATKRGDAWSRVRVVLSGTCGSERKDARSGELAIMPAPGRSLAPESDWLDVIWRSDAPQTSDLLVLPASSFERAKALASALTDGAFEPSLAALGAFFEDLRSLGIAAPAAPITTTSDPARHFAQTLWRHLMTLPDQPMAVDLASALGVSERHALRQTSDYLRAFHLSASSWRELVQCLRIEMGTFFMGSPRARTEDVSRALGFRSPTSFCHAFQHAHLPSPQAVQRELTTQ